MSQHILVSNDPEVLERWVQAFPDACRVSDPGAIKADPGGSTIVWLLVPEDSTVAANLLAAVKVPLASAAVVALSNTPTDEQALELLSNGASGYCHAYAATPTLLQVATVIANNGLWVGPGILGRFIRAAQAGLGPSPQAEAGLDSLSAREHEVAMAVGRGLTNKEIARELSITERTVKAHLSAVFAKFAARDRLQLVLKLRGLTAPRK